MSFSWFKKSNLREEKGLSLIFDHLEEVKNTVVAFSECTIAYLEGNRSILQERRDTVHAHESKADDIRREFELKLYEGAFLPFFRGTYLRIIEGNDLVANYSEAVFVFLDIQCPEIPEGLQSEFISLVREVRDSFAPLEIMVGLLQKDHTMNDVLSLAQEIDLRESAVDKSERELKRKIFLIPDLDLAHKHQLFKLVEGIANISDEIENASDRLEILFLKKKG